MVAEALKKIGLQSPAISELKAALEEDAGEAGQPSFGHRTLDWIKNVGTEAGIFFLKIGVEEAKTEVLKWIQGYLGS